VKGADIDAKGDGGQTALHWACEKGHGLAAEMLCRCGARLNLVTKHGSTALHLASRRGHLELVKVLLAASHGDFVSDKRYIKRAIIALLSPTPTPGGGLRGRGSKREGGGGGGGGKSAWGGGEGGGGDPSIALRVTLLVDDLVWPGVVWPLGDDTSPPCPYMVIITNRLVSVGDDTSRCGQALEADIPLR